MFNTTHQTLEDFKTILAALPADVYTKKCSILSNATIGQHTRHIIELYQCLLNGYESGEVNYDQRKRDKSIEERIEIAIMQIEDIQNNLNRNDKSISISYELNDNTVRLESNYLREVMYNLEHAIHHQALIKVAVLEFTQLQLPDSFGVAPSTLQFRSRTMVSA